MGSQAKSVKNGESLRPSSLLGVVSAKSSQEKRGHSTIEMERIIRMIAGTLVTVSVALGWWVSPYWFLLTAFVGLNLFQSGITRWCLMEKILVRFGVGRKPSVA
jgi:hypothetical protein